MLLAIFAVFVPFAVVDGWNGNKNQNNKKQKQ